MKIKYRIFKLLLGKKILKNTQEILAKWNPYYKSLSPKNKLLFEIRTSYFLKNINFQSSGGFKIDEEMFVLIASAFVQITFGLKRDQLLYFKNIYIAPEPYSYKHLTSLFKGDVNPMTKTITLAWPSIVDGFSDSKDGINLAIHEFAHCLVLEDLKFGRSILNERAVNEWKIIATKRMDDTSASIFRAYGKTNIMEFFAVILEVFFENPRLFYKQEEALYVATSKLLKQDPKNVSNPLLS